jgi:hypothetical protein
MSYAKGNALTEYGFIGLLVLGVCVVALSGLGDSLLKNLDGFQKSLVKKPNTQASLVAGSVPGTPGKPGSITDGGSSLGELVKGLSVKEMEATIQVSGANGATKELASKMTAYASQLLAEGKLSEEQADMISRLANEGHKLAIAEKLLEDAYARKSDSIVYGGQTYTRAAFGELFGFNRLHGIVGSATSMESQMTNAKPMTASFLTMYNQAKDAGALSDPAIARTIENLSTQITVTSDLLKWNLEEADKSGRSMQDYQSRLGMGYVTALYQINLPDLAAEAASDLTHEDSRDICRTGGGQDQGRQCTSP